MNAADSLVIHNLGSLSSCFDVRGGFVTSRSYDVEAVGAGIGNRRELLGNGSCLYGFLGSCEFDLFGMDVRIMGKFFLISLRGLCCLGLAGFRACGSRRFFF